MLTAEIRSPRLGTVLGKLEIKEPPEEIKQKICRSVKNAEEKLDIYSKWLYSTIDNDSWDELDACDEHIGDCLDKIRCANAHGLSVLWFDERDDY